MKARLMAIDAPNGIVDPVPFDFYSGTIDAGGKAKEFGKLIFGMSGNQVCVGGSIMAAHEINSGKLCWTLEGDKFVGHRTPYTDAQ